MTNGYSKPNGGMKYSPFSKRETPFQKPRLGVDIIKLYEYLTGSSVRRVGTHVQVLCPIHSDTKPSCCLYTDTSSFYCFACGVGGDVYTLIEKSRNCGFKEALEIAKEYGQ